MKKLQKIIFIFLIFFTFTFSLTSCKKEESKALSIKDALEYKNGKSLEIEGLIYYKTSEGFYLSDNEYYIYCLNPKNIDLSSFNIGDKVNLKGYYSFFDSKSTITNIDSIKVLSSNNEIANAYSETILNITKKEKTDKYFYSNHLELKGTIIKESNCYYLADEKDNRVQVLNEIDENIGKTIISNYCVCGYDNGFTLLRTTEAFLYTYTLNDLMPLIEIELNDNPKNVYDKLSLVKKSSIEGVSYSYKVDNELINLENFTQVENTISSKLTVTISYKDETKELSSDVNFISDSLMNVSEFKNNLPTTNYSNVRMTGIVIAKLSNSSKTVYSLVIKDKETSDTILLVFRNAKDESGNNLLNNIGPTDQKFLNVSVGFTITFKARYNTSSDYMNTLDGVTELTNDGVLKKLSIDYDNAYTITDRNDYQNLSFNYENYFGKLIKLNSPFLSYSASAGVQGSYILPLYTKDSSAIYSSRIASIDEETGDVTYKTLSFSVDGNDESYGDSSWRDMFNISTKNYDFNKINASIYCYVVPSTGSRIQLVIPSKDYLKIYNENNEYDATYDTITKINNSLDATINHYYYKDEVINLPKKIMNIDITYDTGYEYNVVSETKAKKVTIKASYNVNDVTYTKDVIINIASSTVKQISQIVNGNESAVYAKGVVIGFASETLSSTETSKREYKGLIVKDQYTKECVIVDGLEYNLNQIYPNFTVNNEEIKVGSVITFKGRYLKEESRVTLRYDGEISFVKNSLVEYEDEDFITVTDTQSLSKAIYAIDEETRETEVMYARLIKLVGTEENPIYFTPTSSNEIKSSGKMNFRIHYNKKATAACDTMFNGYSITIKQDNQAKNTNLVDNTWYESIGLPKIGTSGEMYPGAMAFTGEMYIVVCYKSSGSDGINCFYNSCSIVNFENWNLEKVNINSSIEYGD